MTVAYSEKEEVADFHSLGYYCSPKLNIRQNNRADLRKVSGLMFISWFGLVWPEIHSFLSVVSSQAIEDWNIEPALARKQRVEVSLELKKSLQPSAGHLLLAGPVLSGPRKG